VQGKQSTAHFGGGTLWLVVQELQIDGPAGLVDTKKSEYIFWVFHAMLLRLSTLAELDTETATILLLQIARSQRR
jgi:hypothetical protein